MFPKIGSQKICFDGTWTFLGSKKLKLLSGHDRRETLTQEFHEINGGSGSTGNVQAENAKQAEQVHLLKARGVWELKGPNVGREKVWLPIFLL